MLVGLSPLGNLTLLVSLALRGGMTTLCPCCSLFVNTEDEYIPDAESVRQQRELHHQPQFCTLSQCFQLYTKEEQVGVLLMNPPSPPGIASPHVSK